MRKRRSSSLKSPRVNRVEQFQKDFNEAFHSMQTSTKKPKTECYEQAFLQIIKKYANSFSSEETERLMRFLDKIKGEVYE